jgi:hypothetical protein
MGKIGPPANDHVRMQNYIFRSMPVISDGIVKKWRSLITLCTKNGRLVSKWHALVDEAKKHNSILTHKYDINLENKKKDAIEDALRKFIASDVKEGFLSLDGIKHIDKKNELFICSQLVADFKKAETNQESSLLNLMVSLIEQDKENVGSKAETLSYFGGFDNADFSENSIKCKTSYRINQKDRLIVARDDKSNKIALISFLGHYDD